MAISINKPTVNGSNNTWGATINASLDALVGAINGDNGSPDLTSITSTSTELNLLDGAQENTVVNSKAVIYGPAGEIVATTLTATTVDATTVDLGDWTIEQSGADLHFSHNGTVQFKMTSTGTFQANDDVAAEAF